MSEQFQPNWPLVKISELVEINIGGTPSRAAQRFWATKPEGNPWIAISDLKGKYVYDTKEYITDLGAKCSNAKLIEPFTTVMSFKLTVGRTAITTRPMYCNEAIAIFSPKSDALSGGWLYHALPRAALSVVTDNAVKGATLNKAKMAEMTVQLPPITEQRKIAQILDTLDTAIHATEALIDKLKAVKQGLLHDLLTRGIDANGQLRPPQSEAPQLYKESPLGWIPREWEATGLACVAPKDRSVIRTGPFGSSLKGEHWREIGRPVVTIGSLGDGVFIERELLFIDEKTAEQLVDFELLPGDIAFSRVADVGRSVVITEKQRGWIMSSNFMRISVDSEKARPRLLQLLLASSVLVRNQIRMTVNSAGRDVANSAVLMALRFPWPLPGEQDQIIERVESFEGKIAMEETQHQKLLAAKVGLMNDLLTGRVRVTPLLEPTQQAAASTGT